MRRAPSGTCASSAVTELMRPSCTTTVWPSSTRSLSIGTTLTPTKAIASGSGVIAAAAGSTAASPLQPASATASAAAHRRECARQGAFGDGITGMVFPPGTGSGGGQSPTLATGPPPYKPAQPASASASGAGAVSPGPGSASSSFTTSTSSGSISSE